jgi:hypothetical protein
MSFSLTEPKELGFGQVRMRLDLNDGRLDPRCFVDGHQLAEVDVG